MAAIQTFYDLQQQVLGWVDEASSTGTTLTNVKAALNQAHQKRLTEELRSILLWDSVETFTATAGTQNYSLHQEFHRPLYFYNRTKKAFCIEAPFRSLEPDGVQLTVSSPPTDNLKFGLWGQAPVQYQPTSASTVSISSSSASDNSSTYNITVRGVTSGGVVVSNTITPNGTTPVASTTSFTKILSVTKAAAWNGTLTMTSNSAAVTNLTLEASEYGRLYRQFQFLGNPSTGEVIEYRFYRQPLAMVNNYDIPEIPPPHAQILVWDALILMGAYNSDAPEKAITIWRGYQKEMQEALNRSLTEGQSLGSGVSYVRTIGEDDGLPAIFRS